ncbi:hypothetical protein KOR42_36090 [Thalassoglobus neptunius]|uniref:Uncharacterized protein n=2 Tax=Thalassoglobus neptunius TaxID=1938619 RepID=A0A5C5WJA4_9PLAN|nr:hypothetical protein KOR42_36090 [Thalassoglobus neptunius]
MKMSQNNRIASVLNDQTTDEPTPKDIAIECEAIRSNWTPEVQRRREIIRRFDQSSRLFEANLRFIEFLIQRSETTN